MVSTTQLENTKQIIKLKSINNSDDLKCVSIVNLKEKVSSIYSTHLFNLSLPYSNQLIIWIIVGLQFNFAWI